MKGEGLQEAAVQGVRSALNYVTPNPDRDPRVALRNACLLGDHRKIFEHCATQEGLELADETHEEEFDPKQRRKFTILRGPKIERVLLQIDAGIANDSDKVGALHELSYALRGKRVFVLSPGLNKADTLARLLRSWRSTVQAEAEFLPWQRIAELESGQHSLGTLLDFKSPRPVKSSGPKILSCIRTMMRSGSMS
jgi:hypothetical protein